MYYLSRRFSQIAKSNYSLRHVCLSIYLSVRIDQLGSSWADFNGIWYSRIVGQFVKKVKVWLKYDKKNRYFREDLCTFIVTSLWFLLTARKCLDKRFREKQNTYFRLNNFFSRKSCRLWDNLEKCCTVGGHIWQYNMAHAPYMLDN